MSELRCVEVVTLYYQPVEYYNSIEVLSKAIDVVDSSRQ